MKHFSRSLKWSRERALRTVNAWVTRRAWHHDASNSSHCIPVLIPATSRSSKFRAENLCMLLEWFTYWIKLPSSTVFVLSTVKFFLKNIKMYDVHAKTAPKSLLDKFEKFSTQHHYKSLCLPFGLSASLSTFLVFVRVCVWSWKMLKRFTRKGKKKRKKKNTLHRQGSN